MNYGKIILHDVGNGPGIRATLFVSGCTNNCPGCFNPEAQDFAYGWQFTALDEEKIIKICKDPVVSGLSILGGDPFCQSQMDIYRLYMLCKYIRQDLGKTVWIWTGYTWEQLMKMADSGNNWSVRSLLSATDVLVDGPFVEDQKNLALMWRGSANQRIIDVQKSLKGGEVVLYEK